MSAKSPRPALAEPEREHDAAENLYAVVHHVARRLRAADSELGLSPTRFSVLGRLAFHGPRSIGELAAMEQVRSPSMTRLIADMESDGFVERNPLPDDRRKVEVRITPAGRRLVKRARNAKIALFRQALSEHGCTPEEVQPIVQVLARVSDEPLWQHDAADWGA
jgi:DNA-binding MarR family transcriptional regulator